jgi:acyl-CoA reductase-like NAD-dependent aldehyde dehydrogenase
MQKNRGENALDPPHHACYTKTVKKRFLITTRSVDRATWFAQRVRAGVVSINIGTFGSEPHMPCGGSGASGNGTREPGVEALDVYCELENIAFLVRPT